MAIAKMNKLKLISFQNQKNSILEGIQSLQSLELIDISAEYADVPAMRAVNRENLDSLSKEWEGYYNEYQELLLFLRGYLPQQKMLDKLRTPKETLTIQEMHEQLAKVDRDLITGTISKAREDLKNYDRVLDSLSEDEIFLAKWQKLTHLPNRTSDQAFIRILTGTVPQTTADTFIREMKENPLIFIEEVFQSKEEYGINVAFDRRDENVVVNFLNENHFTMLNYEFEDIPEIELKRISRERNQILEEVSVLKNQLKGMQNEEWVLKLLIETAYAKFQRIRAKKMLVDERHLFVLEGWLEKSKVDDIREVLEERITSDNFALVVDDVQDDEVAKVPTVLNNNRFISPFENITAMYSLPKYNEIDPTPFLAPFYLVFFGMMLADLGYGLILFAATAIAMKFFRLDKSLKKNLMFFHLLSYPTMIWGLIYGSFFGLELPVVLLSTMDDVNTILLLSVIFGVIQILLGLGLKAYLLFRDKDVLGAISDGVGWIVIFVGLIILILASMVFPNAFLATLGKGVAIGGVAAILIASSLAANNKAVGFGIGLYNLYGITGYVGDIVSYTRLMALGVSGASIALAFNMIIEFLPPLARVTIGILLFVLLHTVNIGLSLLSAYVHGARLIFVEFFGKFYEGGGKPLEPLTTSEEYIDLKNNYNG